MQGLSSSEWFHAAEEGDVPTLEAGLGAHGRSQNESGLTALMLAAKSGQLDAVYVLAPAETNLQSNTGEYAIEYAIDADHVSVVEALFPLECIQCDASEHDLLMRALSSHALLSAPKIVALGDYGATDANRAAFMYACELGRLDVVEGMLAIEGGPDVIQDAIARAQELGRTEVVQILEAHFLALFGDSAAGSKSNVSVPERAAPDFQPPAADENYFTASLSSEGLAQPRVLLMDYDQLLSSKDKEIQRLQLLLIHGAGTGISSGLFASTRERLMPALSRGEERSELQVDDLERVLSPPDPDAPSLEEHKVLTDAQNSLLTDHAAHDAEYNRVKEELVKVYLENDHLKRVLERKGIDPDGPQDEKPGFDLGVMVGDAAPSVTELMEKIDELQEAVSTKSHQLSTATRLLDEANSLVSEKTTTIEALSLELDNLRTELYALQSADDRVGRLPDVVYVPSELDPPIHSSAIGTLQASEPECSEPPGGSRASSKLHELSVSEPPGSPPKTLPKYTAPAHAPASTLPVSTATIAIQTLDLIQILPAPPLESVHPVSIETSARIVPESPPSSSARANLDIDREVVQAIVDSEHIEKVRELKEEVRSLEKQLNELELTSSVEIDRLKKENAALRATSTAEPEKDIKTLKQLEKAQDALGAAQKKIRELIDEVTELKSLRTVSRHIALVEESKREIEIYRKRLNNVKTEAMDLRQRLEDNGIAHSDIPTGESIPVNIKAMSFDQSLEQTRTKLAHLLQTVGLSQRESEAPPAAEPTPKPEPKSRFPFLVSPLDSSKGIVGHTEPVTRSLVETRPLQLEVCDDVSGSVSVLSSSRYLHAK
ncbi:Ankyrin repeat protein 1 [Giardia muris]|uniref:Ankyrin repeat protein 1 n=1 Tax=Giardia muris TaxID=5742 RepID=A0A4Z1SPL9_GIAMU|nr:Ankyrin repeat protein 1 [Giardia muris]|eukprot:TNJ27746.1 Ankyrin repeat protein 1 [Giardia muris]